MREERRLARERALQEQQEIKETKEVEEVEEKEPSKHPLLKKIILILIIVFVLSFFYVKEIGNKHIMVNEYKIESKEIPDSFDGLKVVHFSDVHYGTTISEKELKQVVNKINEIKPDIVFFTGDLFDRDVSLDDETINKISDILSGIDTTLYKYAIYGDMDNIENYNKIMDKANFIILNNESKLLYYDSNTPIVIAGLNTKPNLDILVNPIDEIDITNLYKIVLIHEPDEYNKIKPYKPNLTLAGHTLGGLVQIPGIKPLFLQEGAKNYYKEHYTIENKDLYISRGLGTYKLPVRINNRPTINFYRFYKVS